MTTIIPLEAAACLLPEPEQAERRQQVIRTLVQAVRQTRELPDGYGLAFPGEADWLARLAEFVAFERNCCPAFRFEIICEPGHGPLWLHIRGEGGVKDMILAELEAAGDGFASHGTAA